MNQTVTAEEIKAARAYEALHVPALFKQFAPLVIKAANVKANQSVLDIACGTGTLAREAIACVGEHGVVAGLDATPAMLEVARQLSPNIKWKLGVAEELPYQDNAFDAVISQFGMMFFKNRMKAIDEMVRVSVPGGRVVVAVWDSLENSEAFPDEIELIENVAGRAAANALRAPFVLGDPAILLNLFETAGLTSIELKTHQGRAHFPDIHTMVSADLRGWLPVMGVYLSETQIESILSKAEKKLAKYKLPDGHLEFATPAHIIIGTKPRQKKRK